MRRSRLHRAFLNGFARAHARQVSTVDPREAGTRVEWLPKREDDANPMTSSEARGAGLEAAGGYGPPGGGYGGPSGGFGGVPPGGAGAPPPGGFGGPPPGGFGGAPPGGYGAPPGGLAGPTPPARPRIHPLALVSLIAGVLSVPACCCWFGLPLPVCAIACGIIGLGKIRGNPQAYSGAVFCIVGIVCGSFGLLISSGFHLTSYGNGFRRRYAPF
jgi:hypothetical protein